MPASLGVAGQSLVSVWYEQGIPGSFKGHIGEQFVNSFLDHLWACLA